MSMDLLWIKYKEKQDKGAKDELIIHYVELVKIIAGRLYNDYNHHVDYEDLVSYGILGLIDAIEKFDHKKMIKFETYANFRIRGAIIDQLRNLDWVPRSMRHKYKLLEEAIEKLQRQFGNNYSDNQLAHYLDISLDDLNKLLSEVSTFSVVSLEEKFEEQIGFDIKADYQGFEPETSLEIKVMTQLLKESIDILPEKEKLVISLYYYDEMTYKEIAQILEISESRISQLHTKAISRLKVALDQ
jgi:RNA polymerase sigma factor for flagellar operon FliA